MKRLRNLFSLLLALAMVFSLGIAGGSLSALAENTADALENPDLTAQINMIWSRLSELKQPETQLKWYYSVTDLNHDGRLEFIAAAQHPADRSTNLRVWEVSENRTALTEYSLNKDPDESFPDIMTDNADTFFDQETNTWSYLCYDNVVISPTEVYTIKCSVHVKDGVIGYDAYALEHTEVVNGFRSVTHTDSNGFPISPDQYNAAGTNAFASATRSSTSFDWFTAESATSVSRLNDSYMVFAGLKAPTEYFPVPKPAALQPEGAATAATPVPEATVQPVAPVPVPVQTPAPVVDQGPSFLMITKNPTNENNRKPGGQANFVACANAFESLTWTFVSPDGGEYSVPAFEHMFADAPVSGEYSTTLTVSNVAWDMSGWGAYCTFYYKGQSARTSTAYMYVDSSAPAAPVQQTNQYGAMSGTAYHDTAFSEYIVLQNGSAFHIDGTKCYITDGSYVDGCSCTVYYTGYPSESTIYRVDIYGVAEQWVYNGYYNGSDVYSGSTTSYWQPSYGEAWNSNDPGALSWAGLSDGTEITQYASGVKVEYPDGSSEMFYGASTVDTGDGIYLDYGNGSGILFED